MKIGIGSWKMRNGNRAEIEMDCGKGLDYRFGGTILSGNMGGMWTEDGSIYHDGEENPFDIVGPWEVAVCPTCGKPQ